MGTVDFKKIDFKQSLYNLYSLVSSLPSIKSTKKTVGIDIGSHSIKLVELEDKKGHLELTKCQTSLIKDGDRMSALKDLLLRAGLSSKCVNVSLSGPAVVTRYIDMPPMKKEEIQSAVKIEGGKYIPFNINESIIDCAILDKASSGAQRVLLVVAKKKEVDNIIALFKEFNLVINVIDVDSFAFLNSFQRLPRGTEGETTYCLINIGARFSNMNIVTKNNVHFTRDIPWGGENITERIKEAMGISLEEAESIKCNPGDKKEKLIDIIGFVQEKLASQIRMSFDYFESQFGKNVERLYISGGSSYLFNMVDFLKYSLAVDILTWDSFDGISLSESIKKEEIKTSSAVFTVAVGLALRK